MDSGCETDCIQEKECLRLGIKIEKLDETDTDLPTQADGQSPLQIIGKARFRAIRGKASFSWFGYVCKKLQAGILCGGSFMERNFIVQELNKKRIVVNEKFYIMETSPLCPTPSPDPNVYNSISNTAVPSNKISNIEIGAKVPKNIKEKLVSLHNKYSKVFDGDISEGYNGNSGDHDVDFNFINNIPPNPSYSPISILYTFINIAAPLQVTADHNTQVLFSISFICDIKKNRCNFQTKIFPYEL